jgi:phospholipid/cholesterol/gamma-HCH transport system permease protein
MVTTRRSVDTARGAVRIVEGIGQQVLFYAHAYRWMGRALRRYPREIYRLLAGVSLGTGALAMIGGTVVVVGFLTMFAGLEVGIQGYTQLRNVGVQSLAGFVSAYVNTREVAPLIAGIALIATVGAGFTAQLGAMRVSEEIDALEVMAIPSIPYLITTRIIAGFIAVIPLYSIALIMSYGATRLIVTVVNAQPPGTYDHYFAVFLIPQDVLTSFVKALVMSVVVMSVHCFYGYTASGGPAGVGQAVGRAVRLSLVLIMFVDLALSLVLYGNATTLNLSS